MPDSPQVTVTAEWTGTPMGDGPISGDGHAEMRATIINNTARSITDVTVHVVDPLTSGSFWGEPGSELDRQVAAPLAEVSDGATVEVRGLVGNAATTPASGQLRPLVVEVAYVDSDGVKNVRHVWGMRVSPTTRATVTGRLLTGPAER